MRSTALVASCFVASCFVAIALGGCSGSSAIDRANAESDSTPAPSSSASSSSSSGNDPPTSVSDAGMTYASDAATTSTALPASFTKRLLDTTTYPNAVCNDGTPAGYYPAAGAAGSQTWILFLEGGSWCSSDADCAGRGTALSSSSGWTSTISPSGIISGDAAQNPHFSAFNRVDVPYCTSDVFSGDAAASSAGKFQFRGRAVIDGVIADLKSTYGFGKPGSTVLLSGASAGGVSVLVTADRIAAALPGVKVVALTDAGFLPDVAPLTGPSILSQFQTAMTYWNGSPDDSCAAANPTEKQKCYLAQYAEPEITTPLFFGQNLEDPHGPLHAGGFTWPTTPTTAQKNWMNDVYTPAMERLLAATSSSTGFFSPCQVVHTMIDNSEWTTATVGSEHYDDAVNAFLNGTSVTRADKTPCSYP